MAQNSTAIAIVSISAGAVIAVGGGMLNAWLARRQAERQFAHEREMADLVELRSFLERALAALQEVVDCILGVASDLDVLPDTTSEPVRMQLREARRRWRGPRVSPEQLNEIASGALSSQREAVVELTEMLKEPLIGLQMRVGGRHPLAQAFQRLVRLALATAQAIPYRIPVAPEDLAKFTTGWEEMGDAHGGFIELAASYVGVDLQSRMEGLPPQASRRAASNSYHRVT